ncbi:hypothetical protein [Georgenia subflava]|uniref:Uncharacterized protein n=1 Tax=Georgenia subflava TaxID=1622177 RepID=A0A6N7EM84_9MICO|nr:hypothetical protein [Georgenia subflava]MPV37256.1 hypothetical protein [Georgenia subflava]
MNPRKNLARRLAAVALAGMTALALAPAAMASPDDASLGDLTGVERPCPLTRLDDQYMRCDNYTGGGVSAPSYVPQGAAITTMSR